MQVPKPRLPQPCPSPCPPSFCDGGGLSGWTPCAEQQPKASRGMKTQAQNQGKAHSEVALSRTATVSGRPCCLVGGGSGASAHWIGLGLLGVGREEEQVGGGQGRPCEVDLARLTLKGNQQVGGV